MKTQMEKQVATLRRIAAQYGKYLNAVKVDSEQWRCRFEFARTVYLYAEDILKHTAERALPLNAEGMHQLITMNAGIRQWFSTEHASYSAWVACRRVEAIMKGSVSTIKVSPAETAIVQTADTSRVN